ncbi:MAG: hypothetical protein KDA35_03355 [Hyphomonadaceae bacterium]|nr:hypothetical protein [Hyphomonadaceae bacterium]
MTFVTDLVNVAPDGASAWLSDVTRDWASFAVDFAVRYAQETLGIASPMVTRIPLRLEHNAEYAPNRLSEILIQMTPAADLREDEISKLMTIHRMRLKLMSDVVREFERHEEALMSIYRSDHLAIDRAQVDGARELLKDAKARLAKWRHDEERSAGPTLTALDSDAVFLVTEALIACDKFHERSSFRRSTYMRRAIKRIYCESADHDAIADRIRHQARDLARRENRSEVGYATREEAWVAACRKAALNPAIPPAEVVSTRRPTRRESSTRKPKMED